MQQVLKHLDSILEQLPEAIKQARERIIGERQARSFFYYLYNLLILPVLVDIIDALLHSY